MLTSSSSKAKIHLRVDSPYLCSFKSPVSESPGLIRVDLDY